MVKPINHYSLESPASIYDEEALTSLELAGRTAAKVNECVSEVNKIPQNIKEEVQTHIDNGTFDEQIDEYTGNLRDTLGGQINDFKTSVEARVNNLLNSYLPGSTTADAELYDIRTDAFGTSHATAGEAVRTQMRKAVAGSKMLTAAQTAEAPYNNLDTVPFNVLTVYPTMTNVVNKPAKAMNYGAVLTFAGGLPDFTPGMVQLFFDETRVWWRLRWGTGGVWQPWNGDESRCFEVDGNASRIFKNVKVVGTYKDIIISNIRNNYEGKTGFTVYLRTEDGGAGTVLVEHLGDELTGHFESELYRIEGDGLGVKPKIALDYDLSAISEGNRLTGTGLDYLIRKDCHLPGMTSYVQQINMDKVTPFLSFANRICVLGDSFATGTYSKDGTDTGTLTEKSTYAWPYILAQNTRITEYNCSKGGYTIEDHVYDTTNWARYKNFFTQYASDVKLVVIALGINDTQKKGGSYLGSMDDISKFEPYGYSFYKDISGVIDETKAAINANGGSKLTKIVVLGMPENRSIYADFNEAMRKVAEYHDVPFIPLHDNIYFMSYAYNTFYAAGHPLPVSYPGMAKAIGEVIANEISANPYFKDWGCI